MSDFILCVDKDSIELFVKEALEQATDEERDNVAKAILGEAGFKKWKTKDVIVQAVDEALLKWVETNIKSRDLKAINSHV